MSVPQAITTLKEVLARAKETIRAQADMLERLTKEPLRFATVVAIRPPAPVTTGAHPTPPEDFKKGATVRVTAGYLAGETGRITSDVDDDGTIAVSVGSTRVHLLVDPENAEWRDAAFVTPTSGEPIRFLAKGDKARASGGDHNGQIGTVLSIADEEENGLPVAVMKFPGCENKHRYRFAPPPMAELIAAATRGTAIVLFDGKEVEVGLPEQPVQVGDTVKLSTQTLQIVDVVPTLLAGEVVGIQKVLDDASSEVDFQGGTRAVYNGRFHSTLTAGDRVVLDPSGLVIIRNLGQEEKRDALFTFTEQTGVTWDDIGGLDDAKAQMVEAIELPVQHAAYYTFYRKKPLKGLLLYGPPGCGKTMLGKAAATAMARLHGGQGAETAFMYVKAPEILNKFVGASEATVRRIFAAARAHRAANGYPAVVFIDEADAILGKRGTGISSDIERTIVPMFLAEMDGFDATGALVILATNRADTLDPAMTRDGRIDRKIKVDRPDPASAAAIFRLHLAGVPTAASHTTEELAAHATAQLFDPTRILYELRLRDGSTLPFALGQLASGALIAGIVDRATTIALRRDVQAKRKRGLTPQDLTEAVERAFRENADLNHDDDLRAFAEGQHRDVSRIERRIVGAPKGGVA